MNNAITTQDSKNLPQSPGVYFLTKDDDILYVGASKNLRNRWVDHCLKPFLEIPGVVIKYIKHNTPFCLESKLIRKFNPELNRVSWGTKYCLYREMVGNPITVNDPAGDKLATMIEKMKAIR